MRMKLGVSLSALAIVAAACGGSSEPGAQSGDGSPASAKLTSITVGYVPYADDVSLFSATDKGFFKKHGLDVKLVAAPAPTQVVAGLVSGQQQFGFVTVPVLINVNEKGTALQCVSTVDGKTPTDPDKDGTMLVAAKDSGVKSFKDFAGKKVGVVQLQSLNALSLKALALKNGMDPNSIQQIQLPFPQMPSALQQGHIAGAVIVSPFVQTAIKNGATVINHPNVELFGGGTIVCFAALGRYIQEHPDVVKAFHEAINEATVWAKDHLSEAKSTLANHLDLTPDQAQAQTLSTDFDPGLVLDSIDKMQGYMKQLGLVKQSVDVKTMVWEGARS